MLERKKGKLGLHHRISWLLVLGIFYMLCMVQTAIAAPIEVSYYYEEVCASCDGTKEFYELYNRVFSSEDKKTFEAKISTYNVFMDSCRVQYEDVKEQLQIPSGTNLPVLVVGDQWISGHENMEAQIRDLLMNREAEEIDTEKEDLAAETTTVVSSEEDDGRFWQDLYPAIKEAKLPVVVLFSTNNCEDCQSVKNWFASQELSVHLIEYNIIDNNCLSKYRF